MLIHLGDCINDATSLEELIDIPLLKIPGNCDHNAVEPRELILTLAGHRFMITHGDSYRVKNGLEHLAGKAAEKRAAVVLFGHTHQPCVLKKNGMLLVNPGALTTGSTARSYALLSVTLETVTAEIVHLP